MTQRSEKILNGMKEICAFIGRSEATALKLHRENGMPIKKTTGGWTAHRDALEQWWAGYCCK